MSRAFIRFCEVSCQEKLALALTGGEDFELLFSVSHTQVNKVEALAEQYSICRIGEIVAGDGYVVIEEEDGKRVLLEQFGYDHFGGE